MQGDAYMSRYFKYETDFRLELEHILNKNGIDNELNTPDFILAEYLIQALDSYRDIQNRVSLHHNLVEEVKDTVNRNKGYNRRIVKITQNNYNKLKEIEKINEDIIYLIVENEFEENFQESNLD